MTKVLVAGNKVKEKNTVFLALIINPFKPMRDMVLDLSLWMKPLFSTFSWYHCFLVFYRMKLKIEIERVTV